MISTSDPALWRPDTFLFGHAEVGCGHGSGIFFDVFLKPLSGALEPLGHAGRVFAQSAGKLAGIVPCMNIAQQDFAVRIGKSGKGGTMHDESLLCEQPIFRRILDSDGIAEGQAVFVQFLVKMQGSLSLASADGLLLAFALLTGGIHVKVHLGYGVRAFRTVWDQIDVSAITVDVDLRHRTGLLLQQAHEVGARDDHRTGLAFAVDVLHAFELDAHTRNVRDVLLVSHCVRSFSFSVVD